MMEEGNDSPWSTAEISWRSMTIRTLKGKLRYKMEVLRDIKKSIYKSECKIEHERRRLRIAERRDELYRQRSLQILRRQRENCPPEVVNLE